MWLNVINDLYIFFFLLTHSLFYLDIIIPPSLLHIIFLFLFLFYNANSSILFLSLLSLSNDKIKCVIAANYIQSKININLKIPIDFLFSERLKKIRHVFLFTRFSSRGVSIVFRFFCFYLFNDSFGFTITLSLNGYRGTLCHRRSKWPHVSHLVKKRLCLCFLQIYNINLLFFA